MVTGGAGYIGAPLCLDLVASGRTVRALDVLLHGQTDVAATLEQAGVELIGPTSATPRRARWRSVAQMRWCTWRRSWATPHARGIPRSRRRSTSKAPGRSWPTPRVSV